MSGPLLQTATSIVCPLAEGSPQVIDLTDVYAIEQRIQEVAFVTKAKAPELMSRFNEAYLFVHKHISLLKYELVRSEVAANKLKSVILLDKVPMILEQKGLVSGKSRAGSADLRDAILSQDEQYQEALDQTEKLKCIIELLKGKLEGFEMAYTSVKKILGEDAFSMLNRTMGSGTGDAPVGCSNPDTIHLQEQPKSEGFGRAKYNFNRHNDDERNR
jgi:hypothetical protein